MNNANASLLELNQTEALSLCHSHDSGEFENRMRCIGGYCYRIVIFRATPINCFLPAWILC